MLDEVVNVKLIKGKYIFKFSLVPSVHEVYVLSQLHSSARLKYRLNLIFLSFSVCYIAVHMNFNTNSG